MSVSVVQSVRARKDVVALYAFIGERDPNGADRFLDGYAASLSRLAEQPDIGSTRLWSNPALRGVRAWPVRGYEQFVIYYRHQPSAVRVLRVLRVSVSPDSLLRNLARRQ